MGDRLCRPHRSGLRNRVFHRWIGDGLDLNGWLSEAITALCVSACQAGGYLLDQQFPMPPRHYTWGHQQSIAATIFIVATWVGYKLTHLTTWESSDVWTFIIFNGCFVVIAMLLAFAF